MKKILKNVLIVAIAAGILLNLIDIYTWYYTSPIYHLVLSFLYFLPFLGFWLENYRKNFKYFILGGLIVSLINDLFYAFFVVALNAWPIDFSTYWNIFNIFYSNTIWTAKFGFFNLPISGTLMASYTIVRTIIVALFLTESRWKKS